MADGGDNVKVAVRMRPFNDREKKLECKPCIRMIGNQTLITNPEDGACAARVHGCRVCGMVFFQQLTVAVAGRVEAPCPCARQTLRRAAWSLATRM